MRKISYAAFVLVSLLFVKQPVQAQIITTIAGNGDFGSYFGPNGDGGTALSASVSYPGKVAVDNKGNIYISESDNSRVRKVGASGMITPFAGNGKGNHGTHSFKNEGGAPVRGDNGPATEAEIWGPEAIAFDKQGNAYIADDYNCRVRKISPDGIITTFAGNGISGFAGDGGRATSAALNYPKGLAIDGNGNVYIADCGNNRIRKVSPAGIITTVVGNGKPGDKGDGGAASAAQLRQPYSVVIDSKGNLFIADCGNRKIRKVTPSGTISTYAGTGILGNDGDNGPATKAKFWEPICIAVDDQDNLYIADSYNNCIRKVNPQGIITTIAGTTAQGYLGDNGPAIKAELHGPTGVAVDHNGTIYIADTKNNVVRMIR